ncbi:MAG: hypothetical protein HGA47_00510 [Zoogloea sp.]|nr:hypothetical protein [Zoogloea sp.]
MKTPARIARSGLLGGALLLSGAALAQDFFSLAEPAILYDAPSPKARPLFVVRQFTPVEVVINGDKYDKVRDPSGGLAWVEHRALSEKRTVIVTAARAEIHQKADAASPVVFEAAKDVVLELLDRAAGGWIKVRHRDGATGFVLTSQVWGL